MDENDGYRGGPGPVLVFCCSGAADVGEIAHRAARLLDDRGVASRFCLAGIGGRVEAMLRKTRQARGVLVIDGCRTGCAHRAMEQAGLSGFAALCVGDLEFEKDQSPVTDDRIRQVADRGAALLAQRSAAGGAGQRKQCHEAQHAELRH